ncbi:MAG: ATP-binding protein, partial [Acidimicrobiales bacterium]
ASIGVTWTSDAAGAELCVTDDGDGLPRSALASGGGYGLLGMQERARAIDGVLELTSLPGAGTTVRLTVRR